MKSVLHRTWAEIDTAAIVRNYQTVKQGLAPTCRCMAVVKANAYGHGAVAVATALAKAGADWFGVSNLNEAIELREGGITAPILILAYTPPEHAERLAQYHLTQAVLDGEYAARLEAAAAAADVTVNAHVALDTGMSRIGFFCQGETPLDELTAACTLPHVKVSGIFTHFAVADTPSMDEVTQTQFRRFTDTVDALAARGITFSVRHCCNSAAALRFPEMHLDMVRAGIVLYGAAPSAETADIVCLRPTMTLKTVIAALKTVPTGTPVSYGHTAKTTRPTVLATLPIGYADGFLRRNADRFTLLINGKKAPLVGRVCMDQCMIDVTDVPDVRVGMEITVHINTA